MEALLEPHSFQSEIALAKPVAGLTKRVLDICAPIPRSYQRFVREAALAYISSVEKADPKSTYGKNLSIETYIEDRRADVGLFALWAFIEILMGLDFPEEVVEDPTFRRLETYNLDLTAWTNDLYSFKTEYMNGKKKNFVLVVMDELHVDVQGAVDYIDQRIRKALEEYLALKSNLPSWGAVIDEKVQKYFTALERTVIGAAHWSLNAPRYFGDDVEEVRRTLWVHMEPPQTSARL